MVSLQSMCICGGGQADLQAGQGAAEKVHDYGHGVIQVNCENHSPC